MDKRANTRKRIKKSGTPAPSRDTSRNSAVNISSTGVTNEERYQLIAKAAYLRAEQRGFRPGSELDDWLAAESEIDSLLTDRR
jgi:hypothetical protein